MEAQEANKVRIVKSKNGERFKMIPIVPNYTCILNLNNNYIHVDSLERYVDKSFYEYIVTDWAKENLDLVRQELGKGGRVILPAGNFIDKTGDSTSMWGKGTWAFFSIAVDFAIWADSSVCTDLFEMVVDHLVKKDKLYIGRWRSVKDET